MGTAAMDTWTVVGRVEDVPLWEGRRVTLGGRRIAIFRTDEGLHAVAADCPHARGPLQDGLVADGCVTCPLHGHRFSLLTGARLEAAGPVLAESLAVYEVAERDGALLLRVPDERPSSAAA